MLNRHWNAGIRASQVVDTFLMSQLYSPNFKGGHSLDAWGQRLKFPKTGHTDFSRYSPEMLEYCRNDTSLTALLFRKLSARMAMVGFTHTGLELEHQAWNIIQNKQRRNGFPFNYKKAHELYVSLRARQEELQREIYKLWPPQFLPVREFAKARKKSGEFTKGYLEHLGQYPRLVINDDGSYTLS